MKRVVLLALLAWAFIRVTEVDDGGRADRARSAGL